MSKIMYKRNNSNAILYVQKLLIKIHKQSPIHIQINNIHGFIKIISYSYGPYSFIIKISYNILYITIILYFLFKLVFYIMYANDPFYIIIWELPFYVIHIIYTEYNPIVYYTKLSYKDCIILSKINWWWLKSSI